MEFDDLFDETDEEENDEEEVDGEEEEKKNKDEVDPKALRRTNLVSDNDDDNDKPLAEYIKHGSDDKIEYETAEGKKVEADFFLDRSKWFRPLNRHPNSSIKPKDKKERRH
ncbi:hypothetical protein L1987_19057 [Smallanthus sonchifolius]|uniref:Uncharacterized protein n=1 Tax=Smallanthus sonchifolius TaxID=185202 RepID=A0ACB9J3L5_9ASTR|nr:hypothetical protein L1987_19057 [Smallanthus sonchifolius]